MRGAPRGASAPPGELLAQHEVPCTDGLHEARLPGLALGNKRAYAVSVRAYDRAGNEVRGCGRVRRHGAVLAEVWLGVWASLLH